MKVVNSSQVGELLQAYAEADGNTLTNGELYERLVGKGMISEEKLKEKAPVGLSGKEYSLAKRALRWKQMTLKQAGLLERDSEQRGRWRLTGRGKAQLSETLPKMWMVGFTTDLGVAIWGRCEDVFRDLDIPLQAIVTSPPYALAQARAYGGPQPRNWVDFILRCLEPAMPKLIDGASVVLNIGEHFVAGSPETALHKYELVLELRKQLGLHLMREVPYVNTSRVPGPTTWACKKRVQLCDGWEPMLWLTNNPQAVRSDNRRVLVPHSSRHLALIERGGENREAVFADGAYRVKKGSFGRRTEGAIPRNVLAMGHRCAGQVNYREGASRLGLPLHGATFPSRLAEFWLKFLCEPESEAAVADLFAGSGTVGAEAERLGIPWVMTEMCAEYVRGAAERTVFTSSEGYVLGEGMESWYREWTAQSQPQLF